jgi:hypothetical protein
LFFLVPHQPVLESSSDQPVHFWYLSCNIPNYYSCRSSEDGKSPVCTPSRFFCVWLNFPPMLFGLIWPPKLSASFCKNEIVPRRFYKIWRKIIHVSWRMICA